jgi:hypothetical protein
MDNKIAGLPKIKKSLTTRLFLWNGVPDEIGRGNMIEEA